MELQDTENRQEDSPTDVNVELVRSVNRYLRKALKKIDELCQNSSPPENAEEIQVEEIESKVNCKKRKKKSHDKSGESCSKRTMSENGELCADLDVYNSIMCDASIVRTEPESPDEADDCVDDNTIEISSDGSNAAESYQPAFTHPNKINQPVIISKFDANTTSISVNSVYKAYIANLPYNTSVPRLQEWLSSKGVGNHEDIIMFTRQTFKTSVVSYFDKISRDRLLSLDKQLFDGDPITIRIFVDPFSPEDDKVNS